MIKFKYFLSLIAVCLFFFFFIYFYNNHIFVQKKNEQSYNYYNMSFFLKENDIKSANFYAKSILRDKKTGSFYHDFALLVVIRNLDIKGKTRKIEKYCKYYVKSDNVVLEHLLKYCNRTLYEKIK